MSNQSLEGQTAVITGGGRGIGEAIAARLHAAGANVVVSDIDRQLAEASAKRIAGSGDRALGAESDVRDRESLQRLFSDSIARFGKVDLMISNAARTVSRSFWEIDDDEWDDVLRVNLRGVFIGCQIAGAHMRANGYGRIINLASLAGQQGGAVAGAHYAASKAGIIVLTKIVARDLASRGVTVNAVAPAAISGPIMDSLDAETIGNLERMIPVGRVGLPSEVADIVAFLASREAGYITGATFDINGGLFMR